MQGKLVLVMTKTFRTVPMQSVKDKERFHLTQQADKNESKPYLT